VIGKNKASMGGDCIMKKRLFNTKGLSLMELIVAILVFSVIMVATTTIFTPMLRAFDRTISLAEANSIMDTIASVILADVNNASHITVSGNDLHLTTIPNQPNDRANIVFSVDDSVLMHSHGGSYNDSGVFIRNPSTAVFDGVFYRGNSIAITWGMLPANPGVFDMEITLTSRDGSWTRNRTYVTRPTLYVP